jgi:hypothetical protein
MKVISIDRRPLVSAEPHADDRSKPRSDDRSAFARQRFAFNLFAGSYGRKPRVENPLIHKSPAKVIQMLKR